MLDTLDEEAGWKLMQSSAIGGILDVFLLKPGEIEVMEGGDMMLGVSLYRMKIASYISVATCRGTVRWPLVFSRRADFAAPRFGGRDQELSFRAIPADIR